VTTGAVAAIGVAAVSRPFLGHMAPAADSDLVAGLEIDLSLLKEGEQMTVSYLGRPVAIRHRTPAEIEAAQADDRAEMIDPQTDRQRLRPKPDGNFDPRFLVVRPICTHFGCVVVGEAGRHDGWYCPCHGANFDTSGRVRSAPAPLNLEVPDYFWQTDTSITLRRRTVFEPS
jgi:ubiquinol-cytochrome c reductase iron-sulfur subunit